MDDNKEFLSLFKVGINEQNNNMFNEYRPADTSNSGVNILNQMTSKKQYFTIKIGELDQRFEFTNKDPIFSLSEPNDDASANQNPFCNCCKDAYKSHKDAKYC